MTWYLRSLSDQDTHRGELHGDGTVTAVCGATFRPKTTLRISGQPGEQQLVDAGPALPGNPPDPRRKCVRTAGVAVPGDRANTELPAGRWSSLAPGSRWSAGSIQAGGRRAG